MADVNRGNRPLSPHLTIYRPQMTSMSSIMVRVTGIASFFLAVLVVAWLLAAATSEAAFATVDGLLTSWIGTLVMLGAAWALYYHMLGRLRHVIWDFGYCLEVEISEKMGAGMFIGATVLTLLTAIVVRGPHGDPSPRIHLWPHRRNRIAAAAPSPRGAAAALSAQLAWSCHQVPAGVHKNDVGMNKCAWNLRCGACVTQTHPNVIIVDVQIQRLHCGGKVVRDEAQRL